MKKLLNWFLNLFKSETMTKSDIESYRIAATNFRDIIRKSVKENPTVFTNDWGASLDAMFIPIENILDRTLEKIKQASQTEADIKKLKDFKK